MNTSAGLAGTIRRKVMKSKKPKKAMPPMKGMDMKKPMPSMFGKKKKGK